MRLKKCLWLVDFNKQHLPWLTRGEVAFKHQSCAYIICSSAIAVN